MKVNVVLGYIRRTLLDYIVSTSTF